MPTVVAAHRLPRLATRLLAGGAVLATGAVLAGCAGENGEPDQSPSPLSTTGTVRVLVSGDREITELWRQRIVPGFRKAHPGITVELTEPQPGANLAQEAGRVATAVQADRDPGSDLIDAGFVTELAQQGLLETPTKVNIPRLVSVDPDVVRAGEGAIPYRASSVVLAYQPAKVPNPPQTLDDLLAWIPQHPGRFTYAMPASASSGQAFVTSIVDKFVPAAQQQELRQAPADADHSAWDRGLTELKGLAPSLLGRGFYPQDDRAVLQLLASGQIWMAPVDSRTVLAGQRTGLVPASLKITQVTQPSFTGSATYVGVPRNAPNKEAALTLANYLLTPLAQDAVIAYVGSHPVIPLSQLPAPTQRLLAAARPGTLRAPYPGPVAQALVEQWDEKVAAH